MEQDQVPAGPEPGPNETQEYSVPWSAPEGWLSVFLLILLNVGLLLVVSRNPGLQLAQSALVVLAELAYILPVVVILAWKRIPWRHLGFGKFEWSTLGIGCGLLIGGYGIIIVHNLVVTALGIDIQGDKIVDIFSAIDSPGWLILALVVVAPLVEEVFFRGFLFQGFRKKYGWVGAMLLSSAIFAAAHLDPVTLIPTFVLGIVLSYVYHRSNSVWPGVILHFLINASSTCSVYVLTQLPNLIPS
jgi:membrane protease YdiL (CAAX protease family)